MTETTTDSIPTPRRLYRTRDGRQLGGVCAGLGRYFDLNPTLYRIAFVALALAGGTGILALSRRLGGHARRGRRGLVRERAAAPPPGPAGAADRPRRARVRGRADALGGPLLAEPGQPLARARAAGRSASSGGSSATAGAVDDGRGAADAAGPGAGPLPGRGRAGAARRLGVVGLLDATGAASVDWRIVLGRARARSRARSSSPAPPPGRGSAASPFSVWSSLRAARPRAERPRPALCRAGRPQRRSRPASPT